ncbi:transcription factor FapR [Ruminiclostridium cellulolyticum]|uniref:Regulatory protein DeoR n=1 Tax=Ruminiclostridium cellulolyticum (strain ATCC 35319 / DSM 5812 / JCM 6584 / H10) TaxID=394503 RepID=B8I7D6_RUMCH|nr:transcription factor FapR [Ruminiclostridium cellulolyticum]ACL75060.1 regulatory protein DeoR [Ruminiclostridium cellulolyticum H10]
MSRSSSHKQQRQKTLLEKIKYDPFLTDEELADYFKVSVPTIRLDRLELAIPELRERIKNVAESNQEKLKSLESKEFIGELIDLQLGQNAISLMETKSTMAFEKTHIVRGHYIYSLAETLAIAVIDSQVALVGVANIKYKIPVYSGARIIAKAQVKKSKGNRFIVWVKIYEKNVEVFRGKFILVSLNENKIKEKI